MIFNIHLYLKSRTQHNLATIIGVMKSQMDENKKTLSKVVQLRRKNSVSSTFNDFAGFFGQFHPLNLSEIVIAQKHIWFGIPLFHVFIMFFCFMFNIN